MHSPRLKEALLQLRAIRKGDRERDLCAHIEALIHQGWPPEDAATLRGELIGELHLRGKYSQAEALLLAEVEREPTEPFHSLSLAEHFHYYDINLPRSLVYLAEAIAKARTDGKFMYQALGVQARVAIELQDWPLLEATLRDLAAYEHTPGNVDVFPESDFLPRIPPNSASPEVVDAYVRRVEYLRSIDYSTMHGARRGKV